MPATPPAATERLILIIDLLCRAVAARGAGGWLGGLPVILIWSRLRRLAHRFAGLAARLEAGAEPDPPRHRSAAPRPNRPKPPHRLPQGVAWLVRLVPEAASGAGQLRHLLTDAELAALIAASPQMGRVLRPLCRMLGVEPPPALAKPRRPAHAAAPAPFPVRSVRPPRRHGPEPAPPVLPAACGPPSPAACGPPVPA